MVCVELGVVDLEGAECLGSVPPVVETVYKKGCVGLVGIGVEITWHCVGVVILVCIYPNDDGPRLNSLLCYLAT